VRTLGDLQLILSAAGKYTGTGVNHATESFAGDQERRALEGGSASLLRYVATRTDGKHLHAETSLIACDAIRPQKRQRLEGGRSTGHTFDGAGSVLPTCIQHCWQIRP